jgi:hypothetical protein
MFVIYPYKLGSKSAKDFRKELALVKGEGIKLVKPDGRYRPKRNHIVIGWGSSNNPTTWDFPENGLNKPEAVKAASNKVLAFTKFTEKEVDTVDWTTNKEQAQTWINEGYQVVARAVLTGHSGAGISLHGVGFADPLPEVPLYTKYKKKRHEYRVHILKGEVIDVVQKKKRASEHRTDAFNPYVRNIGHDWIFSRTNITITPALTELSSKAIEALDLDFGAVDIIWNERENKYYVLEVNTAPGIEGTTLTKYVEAFGKL